MLNYIDSRFKTSLFIKHINRSHGMMTTVGLHLTQQKNYLCYTKDQIVHNKTILHSV